jgi:hypothetical protein
MDHAMSQQNKYWIGALTAVVLVVASVAILNQRHQQQLQAQAIQDQVNREALQRLQSELALKNDLESASQREAALQLQLREMDAGASRLQAADSQQQAN